ncbi:MAG: hypothetical protein ABI442_20660 [Gemmatimonadaceae bacterium]
MTSGSVLSAGSRETVEIARRVLARDAPRDEHPTAEATAAGLQRACVHVVERLDDSLGEDGSTALIARALTKTQAVNPALRSIRQLKGARVAFDGVFAAVELHGVATVRVAIEAFLAALVEILIRLIGEDMASRLIDPPIPLTPTNGTVAP